MSDVRQKYEIDTSGAVRSIDTLGKRIDAYNKVLADTTKYQEAAAAKAQELQTSMKTLPTLIGRASTAIASLKDNTYELRDSFNALNRRTGKLAESTKDATTAMKAFTRSLSKERDATKQLLADTQQLVRSREDLVRVSSKSIAGGKSVDDYYNPKFLSEEQKAAETRRRVNQIVVSERLAAFKRIQAAAEASAQAEVSAAQRSADIRKQINAIFVSEKLAAYAREIAATQKAEQDKVAEEQRAAAVRASINKIFVAERLAAYTRIKNAEKAAEAQALLEAQRAADVRKQINKIFVSERLAAIKRIEAEEKAAAARLTTAEKIVASIRKANFIKNQAELKRISNSYFGSGNADAALRGAPVHLRGDAMDSFKTIDADKARARELMNAYRGVNSTWADTLLISKNKNKAIAEQTDVIQADGLSASNAEKHYDHWRITSIALSVAIGYLAHRAIAGFIQEARDAVAQARDLSLRIAEVQTITLKTVDGFRESALATHQWETQLLALSQAFGVNELQITEGLYQALSNQVIEAGDSVAYMTENLKLSITTTDTLDDTISATSTVINAFNKNVAETGYISAVLFKTVEVGRLRLSELGSQFGRVSVLSRDLGITFEEQAGSIALLTRLGLKADVAMTLLTNVQLKLIKPTAEMTALFNEWGVSSGQAAIATFGFQGVLQKLAAATIQGGDRLAELGQIFQDLRAITGAQGLVSNLGLLNKTINEVSNGTDDFRKAFEISMDSIGRKANVQVQKLSQLFLVQFGQPTLQLLVNLAEGFGGADIAMSKFLGVVQQGVTLYVSYRAVLFATNTAMAGYTLASNVAAVATSGVTLALGAQAIAMAGTTLALTGIVALLAAFAIDAATADARFNSFLITLNSKKLQEVQDVLSKINDELARTTREAEKASTNVFQQFNILIAGLRAKNIELQDDFEKTFKAIAKSMAAGLDKGVKAAADKLKDLDDKVKTLEDKIKAETKAVADTKRDAAEKAFDLRVAGMKPEEAIKTLGERSRSLEAQALAAATKGDLDTAETYRKRADELATQLTKKLQDLREEAQKAGKITTAVSATGTRFKVTTTTGTGKVVKELGPKNLGKGAKVIKTEEIADTAEVLRLDKLIKDNADAKLETEKKLFELREKGVELKKKELEDAKLEREILAGAVGKFQDVLPKLDSFDFKQKDALPQFKKLVAEAKQAAIAAGLDPGEMIGFLRQAKAQELLLERQVEQEKTRIQINEVQKRLDAERAAIAKANADRQAALSKNATDVGKVITDSVEAQARIANLLGKLDFKPGQEGAGYVAIATTLAMFAQIKGLTKSLQDQQAKGEDTKSTIEALTKAYANLDAELAKMGLNKNGPFQLRLKTALGDKIKGTQSVKDGKLVDANGIPLIDQTKVVKEQLDTVAKNAEVLKQTAEQVAKAQASIETIKGEFDKLDEATQKRIKDELEAAKTTAEAELEVQNNLSGTVDKYNEILGALEAIEQKRKAQKEQMNAAGIPPVEAKAHGGRLGTDSVMLAATRGEFVMNRGAAREYAPLLRSMNASGGRGPRSNSTNVSFGDITIQTAPGTTDAQAAEIARRVIRMSRRGILN